MAESFAGGFIFAVYWSFCTGCAWCFAELPFLVWSAECAFLAKLSSGKYIAWGSARGGADLSDVQVRLDGEGADRIWSTADAFLARLSSGKYIAWGDAYCGADFSDVQVLLDSEGADQI